MPNKSSFVVKYIHADETDLEFLSIHTAQLVKLHNYEIKIPEGFIITDLAFKKFISANNLQKKINDLLSTVHYTRADSLMQVTTHIQSLIANSILPSDLSYEINADYRELGRLFTRAQVSVGNNSQYIKGVDNVIKTVLQIWIEKFDSRHLLFNHMHNKDNFHEGLAIAVQNQLKTRKNGSLMTHNLEISSQSKLSIDERAEIKKIGEKIKKHLYHPQIANWSIKKNECYITSIKPLT